MSISGGTAELATALGLMHNHDDGDGYATALDQTWRAPEVPETSTTEMQQRHEERMSFLEAAKAARFRRRGALRLASVTAGATALIAACGGRAPAGKSPSKGTAAGRPGKPRYGGQLNLAQKADPETLDPSSKRTPAAQTMSLTNDSLLGFKAGPDIKYEDVVLQPALAERWELPDAQTFVFHLRPNVHFANLPPVNGRLLSAADVKWSYEYYARLGEFKGLPPAPVEATFQGLDRVDTPDASTVSMHFSQPNAAFLGYNASEWSAILAHEIHDQDGDFSKRATGTGPWQIDAAETRRGERWTFKKNPTYYISDRPYIDQVNWLVLADDATTNAAFQTKQIDMLDYSGLTSDTVERLKSARPDAVHYEYLSAEGKHVYLNVSKPPLNDDRVRKALGLAINRDEFIRVLSQGKGQWALAGATPGLFTDQETRQILQYDPAQAKQLLSQAGYSSGVEIEFMYPGEKYGQALVTAIQLIQSQAKSVGLNIQLKSVTPGDDGKLRRTSNFQMTATPNGFQEPLDVGASVYALFHPKSSNNYGKVNDPKLTAMLDAQRQELDPKKRLQIIRDAVRYANEMVWAFDLYHGTGYSLWQPLIQNYAPNFGPGERGYPIINTWLEK